jgi:hypothetical protein
MRGQLARPVREGGMKKRAGSNPETALHADPTTIFMWWMRPGPTAPPPLDNLETWDV